MKQMPISLKLSYISRLKRRCISEKEMRLLKQAIEILRGGFGLHFDIKKYNKTGFSRNDY